MPKIFGALDSGGDDSRVQHGLYRWDRGQCGIACLAGQSRRHRARCSMGDRELFAFARRAPARRRFVRRLLRASPHFPDRSHHVRRRLSLVRLCIEHQSTDHRANLARAWRCSSGAGQSRHHQRFVSRARSRTCDRNVVGLHCHYRGRWSGPRRLAHRAYIVARDFLHQSPARIACLNDLVPLRPREP